MLALLILIVTSCGKSTKPNSQEDSIPPVYVTVAGHIEDTPAYAAEETYPVYRQKLLDLAAELDSFAIAFNLQIDYEFLYGTINHETDSMRTLTNGLNIVEYLVQEYDFEIDPHQEGGVEVGQDNYADVHYTGLQLCTAFSDVVGGLLWDDPPQFARLATGENGWLYPAYTWEPKVLSLAVSSHHHQGDFSKDDIASGVWKPKGANENFWINDSTQRMIYIGPGEHFNDWGNQNSQYLSTPEFVQEIIEDLQANSIDRTKMYTASLAVPQKVIFNQEEQTKLWDLLNQLRPYIESGQAQYVNYSEAASIWENEFDSIPNIFYREGVEPPQTNAKKF